MPVTKPEPECLTERVTERQPVGLAVTAADPIADSGTESIT